MPDRKLAKHNAFAQLLSKQDRKLAQAIENRRKRRDDSIRIVNVDRMLKHDRKDLLAA